MKRVLSVVLSVCLLVAVCVTTGLNQTTLATSMQSPTAGTVTVSSATVQVNGKAVDVAAFIKVMQQSTILGSTSGLSQEEQAIAQNASKAIATVNSALQTVKSGGSVTLPSGSVISLTKDTVVLGAVDIYISGTLSQDISDAIQKNGVQLTVKISGIQTGDQVGYLHCMSTSKVDNLSTYEAGKCDTNAAKQEVGLTVRGLSPVVFVVERAQSSQNPTNPTAPGTGGANHIALWAALAVVGLAGVCGIVYVSISSRRRKKNK